MDGHWWWGFMGFAWIFGLVILGLIIWAVAMVVRSSQREPGGGESPTDILKKRYARGEISREEFERMKRDLES